MKRKLFVRFSSADELYLSLKKKREILITNKAVMELKEYLLDNFHAWESFRVIQREFNFVNNSFDIFKNSAIVYPEFEDSTSFIHQKNINKESVNLIEE